MNTLKTNRLIAAIQTCRSKVNGLQDDHTWRAFLEQLTGQRSLRVMTGSQLGKLLDELHKRGAPKKPAKAAGRSKLASSPQARMIRGLWIELHKAGKVRDASEKALASFISRTVGVDALQWISIQDANRIIEALKNWHDRPAKGSAS